VYVDHFGRFRIANLRPLGVTAFKDVNAGGGVDSLEAGKGARGSYICTQGMEERKLCIAWHERRHVLGHGSIESIWAGSYGIMPKKYSRKAKCTTKGATSNDKSLLQHD
jgi:hypothetical protein